MSLLSTFVSNINYSPPLVRAREAAESSAVLRSTLADLLHDLGRSGWPLCHPEITWRALGPLIEMWVRANAGLDTGKLFSNAIDESLEKCRDCVEKVQVWPMTEGLFPVTALCNEPHLQASSRSMRQNLAEWVQAVCGDWAELSNSVKEQCGT